MPTLKCRAPRPELREFVRIYAQREIEANETTLIQPVPARLEQCLEFQFGDAFEVTHARQPSFRTPEAVVIGAHLRGGTTITLPPRVQSFAIFFQPTGFSRLFGVPANEVTGRSFEAGAVLGRRVHSLRSQLAECATFESRADLVESVLLDRVSRLAPAETIAKTPGWIFQHHGRMRVADMARRAGLSVRQFERKFHAATGIPPKMYARVARFQTALDIKVARPSASWLRIALDLGYHDQMHLIHDFQDLAGDAPERIFASIGDSRPPSAVQDRFA